MIYNLKGNFITIVFAVEKEEKALGFLLSNCCVDLATTFIRMYKYEKRAVNTETLSLNAQSLISFHCTV